MAFKNAQDYADQVSMVGKAGDKVAGSIFQKMRKAGKL